MGYELWVMKTSILQADKCFIEQNRQLPPKGLEVNFNELMP